MPVTPSNSEKDPLEPLWKKASYAGETNDFPGLMFAWRALVEHGVFKLCAQIGQIYERGAEGIDKDTSQALFWYRKAVFECDDPLGHLGLGRAYYNGVGVERNVEQAKKHFEAANKYDLPQASIYLGIMYYSGTGVERDVSRAKELFERAAAAEYCYAYFMLSRIALREGRVFKGISTWIKGWRLGKKIADKDVTDPRLLGVDVPPNSN